MRNLLCLVIIMLASFQVFAQGSNSEDRPINSINEGKMDEKFEFILKNSNNWRSFKVVKEDWIRNLRSQVSDSLKNLDVSIVQGKKTIAEKESEISDLQDEIESLNGQIDKFQKAEDSINYLGLNLSRSTFKTIVSAIMLLLLSGLIFMYFRFKNSNYVTIKSEQSLKKLQEEYDAFKKRTLEREQVMKREIMDLKNKR